MGIAVALTTYDDFKSTLHALPRKFIVFFNALPGATFYCWAVSHELDALVSLTIGAVGGVSGEPATFLTDFPGAVALPSTLPSGTPIGLPLFASSFTKDFPT